MASIHRDKRGGSIYYCAYRLPNGKRVYRSTGTPVFQFALQFARNMDEAYHKAKLGRLTAEYLLQSYDEYCELVTGQRLKIVTVEEWAQRWLSERQKTKRASATFQKYEKTIRSFLDSLKDRAALNIKLLSDEDVIKFRDKLSKDGLATRTVNGNLSTLRTCISEAHALGYTSINVVSAVANLPEAQDGEITRQPFTLEQAKAIFYAAEGDWKGMCMVGLYVGARLRDAANLRWENIDLQKKQIRFRQRKTRKEVTIVMHEALHDFLLGLPAPDSEKEFLFPSLAGKATGGACGLSAAFAAIMKRAGVSGEVKEGKPGGNSLRSLSFHSYRHSLTSWLANAGVPVELRQQFTGHSSARQNQDYTHFEDAAMRAAIEKLPGM